MHRCNREINYEVKCSCNKRVWENPRVQRVISDVMPLQLIIESQTGVLGEWIYGEGEL